MTDSLAARVAAALGRIRNARVDNDLLSAGMVRDLAVTEDGKVAFTFLLSRDDPATLVREARAAVRAVEGVNPTELRISVIDPGGPPRAPMLRRDSQRRARLTGKQDWCRRPPRQSTIPIWAGSSRCRPARAASASPRCR